MWASVGPVGYRPSCLPPSPQWPPLLHGGSPASFPSSWLSDRLPTSHPLRRENPLQWKLYFALSIMASQSKTKVRCKNPDQREGLDVCPRQQCGSSFPTSVDSASSPSMAFEPSS